MGATRNDCVYLWSCGGRRGRGPPTWQCVSQLHGAVIGAWAVLFAATVLIVGYASQSSIALEQQAHTQMGEFTFEPERNVFEQFDPEGSAPEPWKQEYDLAKEANYEMINIKDAAPDAAEAGAITEGVEDPYSTGKSTLEVPEEVYTQEAPYDVNVVELGEPSLGQPFQELPLAGVFGRPRQGSHGRGVRACGMGQNHRNGPRG